MKESACMRRRESVFTWGGEREWIRRGKREIGERQEVERREGGERACRRGERGERACAQRRGESVYHGGEKEERRREREEKGKKERRERTHGGETEEEIE